MANLTPSLKRPLKYSELRSALSQVAGALSYLKSQETNIWDDLPRKFSIERWSKIYPDISGEIETILEFFNFKHYAQNDNWNIEEFLPEVITYGEEYSVAPDIANGARSLYTEEVKYVRTIEQLELLLEAGCSLRPGTVVTREQLRMAAETAFQSVRLGLVLSEDAFRDPFKGLQLPPQRRKIDYQCRGKGCTGKRMSLGEYLADEKDGWGQYTRVYMLTSSWLNDLDRPLYAAMLYQANKEADEYGVGKGIELRTEAHDAFFLSHGILTPGHLMSPPTGLEIQAKILSFATKQAMEVPRGRRPVGAERDGL